MLDPKPRFDVSWSDRERFWKGRLKRLRFGVEPLEEQVERYRWVTITLTVVPSVMGAIILAIFTGFGRPDIGAGLIAILFAPIILLAWADYLSLKGRFAEYQAERHALEASAPPDESAPPPP